MYRCPKRIPGLRPAAATPFSMSGIISYPEDNCKYVLLNSEKNMILHKNVSLFLYKQCQISLIIRF